MLAGCCSLKSFEDMREQKDEAQRKLAEAERENQDLMNAGQQLGQELYQTQMGQIEQAKRESNLRKNCQL